MKRVFIQTFGCQMNIADSAEMLAHLSRRGVEETKDIESADIVLVNTCTIREHAEHKAVSFLGRLAKWKAKDCSRVIIFAGCAAERLGEALKKDYPFLDIVAGAKGIDNFSKMLDESGLFAVNAQNYTQSVKSGVLDYVTIMRGCNFACSYCIVPSVRGGVKCLSPEVILENCAELAKKNVKEIVLLGQTVNAYKYEDTDFADLLLKAASVKGVERVRFMSPHPAFITPKLIDTIAKNDKIAKHIHLPVQSGSDKILKEMKRGYDSKTVIEKISRLKENGVLVSTDIIVGYPTETEEDFERTLELVDKCAFSFAYCFKFSPRRNTPAYSLKPLASDKEVEKRLDILLNKVRHFSAKAYKDAAGTEQMVLMETVYKGRTSGNLWVKTPKQHPVGSMVRVRIKESDGKILSAE
ncbi:RNA modification enzyme, MiaB family [Elusimicrobium minutum Pei191]|uniref:RNA modification enzyme, MiaB family n=1 Tax=Elusimicrobium minutum (strain Pei191) TaxID=445932 RepID=B2KDS1_ELUMP|nr:tRNA (N6-isopentenyl adenosine(37)-C2)-methylthiotransferase MiaB [Elusimicrobium minutum]ACC98667.1 RNA modification enzyme, MiaB family [Elusimicrobium minutum Pei191]